MPKIAYCGYDFFHSSLISLLNHGHEVAKVFSVNCNNIDTHNQYTLQTCKDRAIPYTLDPINADDIPKLHDQGVELIITAAYHYKVPDLGNGNIRGINVHPTLLPTGRGVWPLPWTILLGHKQSGVSIHKLAAQWDSGDILLQESFAVSADEILESLNVKCQMLAATLLPEVVSRLDHYWHNAKQQDIQAYWPMPEKSQRTLDWNKSVEELDRLARAFGKHGCFARFDQQQWIVFSIKTWKQPHTYTPGEVVHKTNTEMVVAAKDGLVDLLYFNPANE